MLSIAIEDAAGAVRSVLPSPYRLAEGVRSSGVAYRGGPASYLVVDNRGERACDLVISREAAADGIVTHNWLLREDLPGKLREAIKTGGTVSVTSAGVTSR